MIGEKFDFNKIPQRHLSEIEKQFITLRIEKSKLVRDRAAQILNKGIVLFFGFMMFAIFVRMNNLVGEHVFQGLVISGLIVLALSVAPYWKITKTENQEMTEILDSLTGKNMGR
ncbi:hypothetical protein JXB31_00925 [Candidatus Woesearchaeota archaeon]|nr:hypothetical protein [Candidatus Woesearchaeota archaeon]